MDKFPVEHLLRTDGGVPFIEATLVQQKRELSDFAIDTRELDHGRVGVSWKVMEPGDGALIQLVYPGKPQDIRIIATGTIEGQRDGVRETEGSGRDQSFKNGPTTRHDYIKYSVVWGLIGAPLFLLGSAIFRSALRAKRNTGELPKVPYNAGYWMAASGLSALIFCGYAAVQAVSATGAAPPFGP